jgi:copper(I)-binding protein
MTFSRFFTLIIFVFQLALSESIHSENFNFDNIKFIRPHIKILSVSKVGAGYVTIKNTSKFSFIITDVHSPFFEHIELHDFKEEDGIAIMRKVEFPHSISKDSSLIMESNSWHLMLFHPTDNFKNNQEIPIFFVSGQNKLKVNFKIILTDTVDN